MANVPEHPKYKGVQEMATEQLQNLGSRVLSEVAARFAEREVKKRVDIMAQALDKVSEMMDLHVKLGPDQYAFDAEGKKTSESFSKKRIDEINTSKGKIEKFQNAITKAHENGDYSDLNKLLGSGQKDKGADGAKDSGEVAG